MLFFLFPYLTGLGPVRTRLQSRNPSLQLKMANFSISLWNLVVLNIPLDSLDKVNAKLVDTKRQGIVKLSRVYRV